jgi:hypothetical protein
MITCEPVELGAKDLYAVSGGAPTAISNIGSFNLNGSLNGNGNGNGNTGLLGINGNFNGDFNGNILAIEILIPISIAL